MPDGTLALSMPGLFLTCVQYFTLIQLGRNFDKDFGSCLLQLRGTELRLHRWGKAAGITDDGFGERFQAAYEAREIQFAVNALKQIDKQLKRAEEDAQDIVDLERSPEEAALSSEAEQLSIDGTARMNRTYKTVERLKSGYQRGIRGAGQAVNRTRWALCKKTELVDLVSRIEAHVVQLETIFPQRLQNLAVQEAGNLEAEEIQELSTVTAPADPLAQALKDEAAKRNIQLWEGWVNEGDTVIHMGNEYRSAPQQGSDQTWRQMSNRDNSRVHAGNVYH